MKKDKELGSLAVYCGSSLGLNPAFQAGAAELGMELGSRGIALVYGGAQVGLMGVVADAVLASGGRVVGVIPEAMIPHEVAHGGLQELHVVTSMHERKALMAEIADAFLALPGGYGTLDEMFEILTWAQLGLHAKPSVFCNLAAYYDPLLSYLDSMVQNGLVHPDHRRLAMDAPTPAAALDLLESILARPGQHTTKWEHLRTGE